MVENEKNAQFVHEDESGRCNIYPYTKDENVIGRLFRKGEGVNSVVQIQPDAVEKPEAQPKATGESCISIGRYNRVSGKNAMAVNYNNQVAGAYAFAANHKNIIGEDASAAFAAGYQNKVYAPKGFAAGLLNQILLAAVNGFAVGEQNVLGVPNGARFGQWCDEKSDALFAIGNGTRPSDRRDAFAVFMDGSMALNKEVFTAQELRQTITRAATMAAILLSDEKAAFTTEELRQTVDNVAKFTPEQLQAVIDYVEAYPASTISTVVDKSAMMSPIIHTETGETVPVLTALQLIGLSVFGKTTQEGLPAPETPAEISFAGDDGSVDLCMQSDNGQVVVLRIPTPNGLHGVLVSGGGNYTDESGQHWMCDEIDLARGVYVQRVGKIVLDGSEGWYFETGYTNIFSSSVIKSGVSYRGLSDKMLAAKSWSNLTSTPFSFGMRSTALTINLGDDINTVEAAQAWLAENTPTVLYALNQPVEMPLEDLYKSTVVSFGGGDGSSVAADYETDGWVVMGRYGTLLHTASYIQASSFYPDRFFALEIKNDGAGVFDMALEAASGSVMGGAEVYLLSEAPTDGWSKNTAAIYTPNSSEYLGILDGADADAVRLAFRRDVTGNFYLLFKATDLDTNSSGNLRLISLTMEQVHLEDCLENKPVISVTAEGAGLSVTYAADTKTYIDYKFAELQNAILSAGANI